MANGKNLLTTGLLLARRRRSATDLLVKSSPNDVAPVVFGKWVFGGISTTNVTVSVVTQANATSSAAIEQTHLITSANVSSSNAVSTSAINQTHLVGTSNATQANAVLASAIVQQAYVSATSVTQNNRAIPAQIHEQRHYIMRVDTTSRIYGAMVIGDEGAALLGVANVSQANAASSAEIDSSVATTLITTANVSQSNASSSVAIKQTHYVRGANVSQSNACSQSSIGNQHLVFCGGVTQVNSTSGAAIKQTHLLSIFNAAQSNTVTPSVARMLSGHTMRVSTTPLISGAMVVGDVGLGVIGAEVPDDGDDGAGYLYNDITLPDDANKEVRGEIVTWPLYGDLVAYEDSSFIYTPDNASVTADSFEYQLYINGVSTGSPITVDISFVGNTQYISVGEALQSNDASPVAVNKTVLVGVSSLIQVNGVSPVIISVTGSTQITVGNATQENNISGAAISPPVLVSVSNVSQSNSLSQVSAGHGYTTDELVYKLLTNKHELDPYLGVYRVFNDDGVTVLMQAKAWQDEKGTIPYRGHELRRIDRLV